MHRAEEERAQVWPGTRVTGLVMEAGTHGGGYTPSAELRASLVVGADGTRSSVARMVGAGEYCPTPNERLLIWG